MSGWQSGKESVCCDDDGDVNEKIPTNSLALIATRAVADCYMKQIGDIHPLNVEMIFLSQIVPPSLGNRRKPTL